MILSFPYVEEVILLKKTEKQPMWYQILFDYKIYLKKSLVHPQVKFKLDLLPEPTL